MTPLFVTGMLRSGTTLAQTLLTNHPDCLVVYQPFHQLYVDAKQRFLDEAGIAQALPLDDGVLQAPGTAERFTAWLQRRRFTLQEAIELLGRATSGKGGGLPGLAVRPTRGGGFADLLDLAHRAAAAHLGARPVRVTGSKEILCEEFVPHLVDAGTRCILVIRDPRAVVASAGRGAYRRSVGDRYPLRLLLGLWRKSAHYWLRYRDHPAVLALRYEDLAGSPAATLARATSWLGLRDFGPGLPAAPLLDHAGNPWHSNSSFGSKAGVDTGSVDRWRELLDDGEARCIAACARQEMAGVGYQVPTDLDASDIASYREAVGDVRAAYLSRYPFDAAARAREVARFTGASGDAGLPTASMGSRPG